jgi:hypothetical protein
MCALIEKAWVDQPSVAVFSLKGHAHSLSSCELFNELCRELCNEKCLKNIRVKKGKVSVVWGISSAINWVGLDIDKKRKIDDKVPLRKV